MAADLHDQLWRGTRQEFIGAKGAAAGVRRDPGIFGFCNNNVLVTLLVGCLYQHSYACQLAYFLNMPVQLFVCCFWDFVFKTIYDSIISCRTQEDNNPMVGLPLLL